MLQLVGSSFSVADFACASGVSIYYLNNAAVLGLFQSSSVLTTTFFTLSTTQTAIYGFNLYLVGAYEAGTTFVISANGVNVFSSVLSASQSMYYIETQFATSSQQAILMSFSFVSASGAVLSSAFQWGINNVAISYSTTAVGTILSTSGSAIAISSSWNHPLLFWLCCCDLKQLLPVSPHDCPSRLIHWIRSAATLVVQRC